MSKTVQRLLFIPLIGTKLYTYIHGLFDNAGYRIRKAEVLMWTCLSTY